MGEYVIPVAFSVEVDNEDEAAKILLEQLFRVDFSYPDEIMEIWMPNHSWIDESDRGAILVFLPIKSVDRETIKAAEKEFYTKIGRPEWANQEEYNNKKS